MIIIYELLGIELDLWQIKDFRFAENRIQTIENESLSFEKEILILNEKQVYNLSIQGLTVDKKNNIYNNARDNFFTKYKPIFYLGDPYTMDPIKTIMMGYLGNNTFLFNAEIDYRKINITLNGVLYDMTLEVIEER